MGEVGEGEGEVTGIGKKMRKTVLKNDKKKNNFFPKNLLITIVPGI